LGKDGGGGKQTKKKKSNTGQLEKRGHWSDHFGLWGKVSRKKNWPTQLTGVAQKISLKTARAPKMCLQNRCFA